MEWTTENVQREVHRAVSEAMDREREASRIKRVLLKRGDYDLVLNVTDVIRTPQGTVVMVSE